MSRAAVLVPCLIVCLVLGCGGGKAKPDFKPILITGKVVEANGAPVTGGILMLRSVPNGEYGASGLLDSNGAFKLSTIVGNDKVEGIPAGEYKVTFGRRSTSQADLPVDLKQTCKIAPDQKELEIKLE
jgi:hypothetical protein